MLRIAKAKAPQSKQPMQPSLRPPRWPWPSPPGWGRAQPAHGTRCCPPPRRLWPAARQAAPATARLLAGLGPEPVPFLLRAARAWRPTRGGPWFRCTATMPACGEQRFQSEHERRAGSARVLQAPGQGHRPQRGAKASHRQEARNIGPLHPRSCAAVRSDSAPIRAAPKYSSAAVVKAPSPAPSLCTAGVLMPKSTAASRARKPPRKAGRCKGSRFIGEGFEHDIGVW